jgi:CDGSH-type Zn-finger protein
VYFQLKEFFQQKQHKSIYKEGRKSSNVCACGPQLLKLEIFAGLNFVASK